MNIKRLSLWAGLLPLCVFSASAQVIRAKASVPTVVSFSRATALGQAGSVAPISLAPALGPSLGLPGVPSLPSPAAAPLPTAPQAPAAATAESLSAISQVIAPDLARASDARQSGEASSGSAERVMAALLGPTKKSSPGVFAASQAVPGRKAPLVPGVVFAPAVTPEQQARLTESLTRRKAGWSRGLAQVGVKLSGPVAPQLSVREAKDIVRAGVLQETVYTVDWSQGRTHLGSFRAAVAVKDPAPKIRSLGAPAAAPEQRLRIRFRADVSAAEIEAFLETHQLRSLSRSYKNEVAAAVTGEDKAGEVSRALSARGIVLYATDDAFKPADARQLTVRFKRGAADAEIQRVLRGHGLRVLSIGYGGEYVLGVEEGSGGAAAALLSAEGPVFWASPKISEAREDRMAVLRFKEGSEDEMAAVLRGLTVVKAYDERSFRVAGAVSARELAESLASEGAVLSAVAVGSVRDEQVRGYARGTASHKGRPWSSTEYNMSYAMGYDALAAAGATEAQLALYRELCDAAPVQGGGFNPWSGD